MVNLVNLWVNLDGENILKDINLSVPKGISLGIIGRSGCGKTSLLKTIIGLIKPSMGIVEVFGERLNNLSIHKLDELRRKIGMVFQYSALFDSLTAFENVAFPLRQHIKLKEEELRAAVKAQLAMVGLGESCEHLLPEQLSGGMRKRIGIARALILQPKLLLLDEPTAGLDPPAAASIDALIKKLQAELCITVIVATHDINSIYRVADRVAFMEAGEIIFTGDKASLKAHPSTLIKDFFKI